MQNIDLTGLSPDQIEYVTSLKKQKEDLSKTVESQQVRIDQLMELLLKSQKAMYGRASEKSRYVLSGEVSQISIVNVNIN